jgi:exopolysaccharide biosynthesis polyprenyl glycosylphosphotransferase
MAGSRRGDVVVPLLMVVTDAVAIELAFLFSYALRFRSGWMDVLGFVEEDAPALGSYVLGSLVVILLWLLLFGSRRMYRPRRNINLSDELVNVARVVSQGMLIVLTVAFFYRQFSYSRVVFVLVWIVSIVLIFSGRALVYRYERRQYRKRRYLQHAIILGSDSAANQVFSRLQRHPSFGFQILGYFADRPAHEELALARANYYGPLLQAPAFIRDQHIDLAFIAVRAHEHAILLDVIAECEGVNIEFMMVPDMLEVLSSRMVVRELEGIPFLRIKGVPFTAWGRFTKRGLDLIVSACVLAVTSPFLALIAAAIVVDSKGPVLFRQTRVGLDGREFTMLKFRSMRMGSERYDTAAGLGLRNDPRTTRVGEWLRRTSIDELPQLYNVLRGDMSLVGPRPERSHWVEEFRKFVPKYLDRHRVKTGVTGWAQVNGFRGDTSIEERIKHDLYYIENWSMSFDIRILLRTIGAVINARAGTRS